MTRFTCEEGIKGNLPREEILKLGRQSGKVPHNGTSTSGKLGTVPVFWEFWGGKLTNWKAIATIIGAREINCGCTEREGKNSLTRKSICLFPSFSNHAVAKVPFVAYPLKTYIFILCKQKHPYWNEHWPGCNRNSESHANFKPTGLNPMRGIVTPKAGFSSHWLLWNHLIGNWEESSSQG